MKPPILILTATLLAWPAVSQAPIDPPVASLPLPSVAVEALQSHPAPAAGRRGSAGSIVLSAPEEERVVRVPLKPRDSKDGKTVFREPSGTVFLAPAPGGRE